MINLKSNTPNKIKDLNSDFIRDYYPDDIGYGNNILWSSNRIIEYLKDNKEVFQINHMVFNLDNTSLPTLNDLDYIIVINGGNNYSKNVKDKSGNFITVQNNQILKYMGSNEYIQVINPQVNKIQQVFNVLNIATSTFSGSQDFNLLKPSYYQFYQNGWFDLINGYLNKNKLINDFILGAYNNYDLIIPTSVTENINTISENNFIIPNVINNHYKQFSLNITYSCSDSQILRIFDGQNINQNFNLSQGNNLTIETDYFRDTSNNIIDTFNNLNMEISTNTGDLNIHNLKLLYYNKI